MPTAGMDGAAGKRCIFLRKAFQKGKVRPFHLIKEQKQW
jgi:hypothetical protein